MIQNTVKRGELRGYIERIEAIRERKKEIGEEEKVVFAELKAAGYSPEASRYVLKARQQKPQDREEAETLRDMYMHAMGLAPELPLFREIGNLAANTDLASKDALIAAFKEMVPPKGEIIIRVGGKPVRIWRDKEGEAKHEDYVEPVAVRQPPAQHVPAKPAADVPDVDDDGAEALGLQAAKDNVPVVKNPFPFGDSRRAAWDKGWRIGAGNDGTGADEDE